MQIIKQACGVYETNCYILFTPKGEFIIDPGTDALLFIKKHVKKPLAILNTHGHYDHIWDNAKVKKNTTSPFIFIKMMLLCYMMISIKAMILAMRIF